MNLPTEDHHLARAGYDVTWWTDVVDHLRKQRHGVPVPAPGR